MGGGLFADSVKKRTHPGTAITPGYLRKALKPRSTEYLGHCKATFRNKLLLTSYAEDTKSLPLYFDTTVDSVHLANI